VLLQPFAAAVVLIAPVGVMSAVEFYDEAFFERAEVGDEGAYWNLSSEFRAGGAPRALGFSG